MARAPLAGRKKRLNTTNEIIPFVSRACHRACQGSHVRTGKFHASLKAFLDFKFLGLIERVKALTRRIRALTRRSPVLMQRLPTLTWLARTLIQLFSTLVQISLTQIWKKSGPFQNCLTSIAKKGLFS